MARRVPNQAKENNAHYKRIERYVSALDGIYQKATDEAVNLALLANHTGDTPFKWSDYPQTKAKLDDIKRSFARNIRGAVVNGVTAEWGEANFKNDRLAKAVIGIKKFDVDKQGNEVVPQRFKRYFQNNDKALSQFISRKDKGGLDLSKRVWNLTENYTQGLETALATAIGKGTDAVTLSKRVSKYLHDYPSLKADYTEKFGTAANILDCEWRSARLARTEINMAYRKADAERWSQMDFVVGFEVKRSGRDYDCPVCSALADKYPPDFVWVGWHPSCRCYVIPILKTDEEFWAWDGRGEAPTGSVNEVKDVPQGFKNWVNDNMHRAKSWSSSPYFIRDNARYIPDNFKIGTYSAVERSFVRKGRTDVAMQRSIDSLQKAYSKIPETELGAMHIYTQGAQKGNFREINRHLRKGTTNDYVDSAVPLISSGLSKLPKVDGTVYRGTTMSMKKLKELYLSKQGQVVEHPFFTSASQSRDVARAFTDYEGVPKSHKRIVFDIQSKNGRDISDISEFNGIFNSKNQREVLFDKGVKYYVSPDIKEESGYYYIKLIEK